MRCLLALGLIASGSMCACGTNAADLYAGLEAYEPRSGAYRLHYLAPPWEVVSRGMGDDVRLEVEGAREGVPPKYRLDVDLIGGAPMQRARAVALEANLDDQVSGPRELTTDSGVEGVETVIFDTSEGRYERHAFLARPGGVVRLVFVSTPNVDNDEVEAMIAAVEVGPFDE